MMAVVSASGGVGPASQTPKAGASGRPNVVGESE